MWPFAHPLLPPKVLLLPYCYPHCRSLAHMILRLLSFCYAFTKLVHIARSTPPSLALDELHVFDQQVRHTFTECQAIHTTDSSWKQAQLSLSRGGLGLCSLAYHSTAAFIASISTAGPSSPSLCLYCIHQYCRPCLTFR